MAITVIRKTPHEFTLNASQLEAGKAYMDEKGNIYIGNLCNSTRGTVYAFSVCGLYLESDLSPVLYKEIDLEIIVK